MENEQTGCNGNDTGCRSEDCGQQEVSRVEVVAKEIDARAEKELTILKLKAKIYDTSVKIQQHQQMIKLHEKDVVEAVQKIRALGGN